MTRRCCATVLLLPFGLESQVLAPISRLWRCRPSFPGCPCGSGATLLCRGDQLFPLVQKRRVLQCCREGFVESFC